MPTLRNCLRLIGSAKASAREPESAYVLRTRLKRSLLGASQLAATCAGVAGPLMPEDIDRMSLRDPASSEVLRVCVSLLSKTRSLCQPSEALDARWRSGWAAVHQDLDLLERTLLSLGADRGDGNVGMHVVQCCGTEADNPTQ
jgi:hypothetical protein